MLATLTALAGLATAGVLGQETAATSGSVTATTRIATPAAPPSQRKVGMNLTGTFYYSSNDPFIDRFKSAEPWSTSTNVPVATDKAGWPLAVPAGTDGVATVFYLGGNVPADPGGKYIVSWEGTGQIITNVHAGLIRNGEPMDVPNGQAFAVLKILKTDPSDPVRNIHIVRADQAAAFAAGELFNSAFLARAKPWSVLRFMDWGVTNGNETMHWSERTLPTNALWTRSPAGVPLEVEVALANRVHADAWINVPAKADDDYIRQIVTYVRDHLDPTLKLHLEYSNEVWNYGFSQAVWAQIQSRARFGAEDSEVWYGYRAAQMSDIARKIYGRDADARLSVILATHTAWLGREAQLWRGVALAPGSHHFDEWAITTYFGDQLSNNDTASTARLMSWANGGDAGMNAVFNEIQHGGSLASNFSMDWLKTVYAYHAKVASAHHLRLVAYEGGFGPTSFSQPGAYQDKITAFIAKIAADPRMGKLYSQMLDDFYAAGGDELTAFTDIGPVTKWGGWGLINDSYSTSPRWDALVARSKK